MIDENTTLADVASAVAAALREIDHDPVVVGGSAATVHAPEAYRSDDVDMVLTGCVNDSRVLIAATAGIDSRLTRGHFFELERRPHTADFVPSTVALGGDVVSEFAATSGSLKGATRGRLPQLKQPPPAAK